MSGYFAAAIGVVLALVCMGPVTTAADAPKPDAQTQTPAKSDAAKPDAGQAADQAKTNAKPPAENDSDAVKALLGKLDAAKSSTDLSDAVKKQAIELYQQAIGAQRQTEKLQDHAKQMKQALTTAPPETDKIRAELEKKPPTPPTPPDASQVGQGMKLDAAELQLRKIGSDLVAAQSERDDLDQQIAKLRDQPKQLQQDQAEAQTALTDLQAKLSAPPTSGEPPIVTEARHAMLTAKQSMRQAQLDDDKQTGLSYDARWALVNAKRDQADRQATQLQAQVDAWRKRVRQLRNVEAAKTREHAEAAVKQAGQLPPRLAELAKSNVDLSKKLEALTKQEAEVGPQIGKAKQQLDQVQQDFSSAKKRIDTVGLTESLGLLLRQQWRALPDARTYRKAAAENRAQLSDVMSGQIDTEQSERDLSDIQGRLDDLIDQWKPQLSDAEKKKVTDSAQQLIADRHNLLDKLDTTYNHLQSMLNVLEDTDQQVARQMSKFGQFIDEHLLWIRSSSPLGPSAAAGIGSGVVWLVQPGNWAKVATDGWASVRNDPLVWLLGVIAAIVLIILRRRMRRGLDTIAGKVAHAYTDRVTLTLKALGMTIVLVLGWPLLLAVVGLELREGIEAAKFTHAVGAGLFNAALLWLLIDAFRELCRPNGLADAHFRWFDGMRKAVRRNLLWLMIVVVPLAFIVTATRQFDETGVYRSLGRVALILLLVATALFAGQVLRPKGAVMGALVRRRPNSWLAKLRYVWYALAVGVPLVLGALAGYGYDYTAIQLQWRLQLTVWMVLGLIIAHGVAARWLVVAQRRMAWAEAQRQREAERKEREERLKELKGGDADDGDGDDEPPEIDEPEIGLAEVDEQTRSLLHILLAAAAVLCLWFIWLPVLPALNILNAVHIWTYTTIVDGAATQAPITLADLLLAIVIAVITYVASTNLPGVMEIVVLRHLPLDPGARYASTTITRYVIVAVGIILTFGAIGVGWDNIQWLLAALGVGLGFGLQEIVANFVSGLIILFERPYRVGDFVTVDDVDGWVTRIRIRATTITGQDRRELIVPNKEFITGQLINWSLSDPIIRLTIQIGIAYGSDTDTAEKLMLEAAQANANVLKSPEPRALFVGFGDNTLNYELRVFINEVERRFEVIHQIHKAVDKAFREADVVIAFPQRDVHFDATQPIPVRVSRRRRKKRNPKPDEASDD